MTGLGLGCCSLSVPEANDPNLCGYKVDGQAYCGDYNLIKPVITHRQVFFFVFLGETLKSFNESIFNSYDGAVN